MKRELSLIFVGLLIGAMGLKIGMAIFSDISLSEKNEISTGEFDVRISKTGTSFYNDLKLFDFDDLKPGDEVKAEFYIKNSGDFNISRIILIPSVQDLESGDLTDAEAKIDTTPDVGELSKNLIIEWIVVTVKNQTYTLSDYSGKTLFDLNNQSISLLTSPLAPSETLKVSMFFLVNPDAGNEIQKDLCLVSLQIYAEQ
ncbi:methyltransferase [Thermococcus sp. 101 C5]|uniref:TasA family protein n=1 Tax=Thermococcus TaxID=2263 RepID=UPI00128E0F85|nr:MULTISPECIES: TasA family protein [Thermococcus]MCA6213566.1 methyltransferase [Thermococcus bergensis]MDK2784072.1 spore coat-associated protein [Thermococcaceae archaeon]MPW39903.1 methyltransferase [Thermococcus sp. 101 C5]